MGKIKDSINKGFTVGDVTTASYDADAKIKVKEYYELDKLERKKLLELAGQIDTELATRDTKIGELEEKIESGSGTGGSIDGMNTYYTPSEDNYYVLYKKVISRAEIDEKCKLTLDKYNNMTSYEKSNFEYVLSNELGVGLPVTLEKITAFINGKPTGKAEKNLMFICEKFSEGIELQTDLNLEFYSTGMRYDYIVDTLNYYKLFLPKLTIFINSKGELIFSENEAFGSWKMLDGDRAPIYESSGCPIIVGYEVLENGDYEITISLSYYYKSYYLLRTNVKAEKVTKLPNLRKNLKPMTEFNCTSIFYNSVLGYAPVNIDHYLSAVPLEKIKFIHIKNTVGSQTNEVNMQFSLKEDIEVTAGAYTDKKIELFKNLNLLNIDGNVEVILSGTSLEPLKAVLNRSTLTVTIPKGETLTLKKLILTYTKVHL